MLDFQFEILLHWHLSYLKHRSWKQNEIFETIEMTISPTLLLHENSQYFDFCYLYVLNFQHFWIFLVQRYNFSSLFINSFPEGQCKSRELNLFLKNLWWVKILFWMHLQQSFKLWKNFTGVKRVWNSVRKMLS